MDAKTKGWVSYITIVGWIIAFVTNQPPNKEEQASFHIRQSLGIILLGVASGIIGRILFMIIGPVGFAIANVLYVVVFVLWILGIVSAVKGTRDLVPFIGMQFQVWFKTL